MSSATFDFAPLLPPGLPAPAAKWTGLAKYNFIGGNNDADQVPVEGLIAAVERRAQARGQARSPPMGSPAARRAIGRCANFSTEQAQARRRHRLHRRRHPDRRPGSLQALDLVNAHAARARRHRHHRAGQLPGRAQPADPARRQCGRHSARPATACAWTRSPTRSTTSSAAASRRNTSTPSRRCRTRPAPSCPRRAAPSC